VVVSGLPGSGKTDLARKLAPLLQLPVIDKDEILERLFDSRGVGDAAWRRTLSRESDVEFRRQAEASTGALLVSFWRLPGMPAGSGTPTDWLQRLSTRIVHLRCTCPVELAVSRFTQRRRHHGHLDRLRTFEQISKSIAALAQLPALEVGHRIDVDTTAEIDLQTLVAAIDRVNQL